MTAIEERPGSRVVILDPDGRVLLFRAPLDDGRNLWLPPGGGVEPGETFEDCARREVWEETGRRDLVLGPWIWDRRVTMQDAGAMFDHRPLRFVERYYLVRVDAPFDPAPRITSGWESFMGQGDWFHWCTVADIESLDPKTDPAVPRELAKLLAPLIDGELPAEPLKVGL